jgi:hypothetical protein
MCSCAVCQYQLAKKHNLEFATPPKAPPPSPRPAFGRRYAAPGPCCVACAPDFLAITPLGRPVVPVSAAVTPKAQRGGNHALLGGEPFRQAFFRLFPFP